MGEYFLSNETWNVVPLHYNVIFSFSSSGSERKVNIIDN